MDRKPKEQRTAEPEPAGSRALMAWLRHGVAALLGTAALSLVAAGAAQAAAGDLDPNFSGDGKQTTDFGARDTGEAVAMQPDGKIVVVGSTTPGGDAGSFAVARYNADGTPDTTFSGDGKQTTN